MTFDPNWPHGHTYNGKPAKLVFTSPNTAADWPHLFVINEGEGGEAAVWAGAAGDTADGFIENAPAPKRRTEYWQNWYESGVIGAVYYSRKEADKAAADRHGFTSDARIACKHVVIEDGEGL